MGLLAIVEDEPRARRLVLRAAPWSVLDRVRRGFATSLTVVLAVVWLPLLFQDRRFFCVALTIGFICFGLAYVVFRLPSVEVEELVVDGEKRTLSVGVRGQNVWGRRTITVEGTDDLHVTVHGLGPAGPSRHELGIGFGGRRTGVLPLFGIEGVDRREEVEALVHVIAARLDRRIASRGDDLRTLGWTIGPLGDPPRPAAQVVSSGYRDAPIGQALDVSKRRGFERPARLPRSLDETTGSDLRGTLERRGVWVALRPPRHVGWIVAWLAATVVFAWIGGRDRQAGDWSGVGIGALLPTGILLGVALLLGAFRILVAWPLRVLTWSLGRDVVGLPRSPRFDWGSGFSLEADHLRARVFGWPRTVRRGDDGSLFLVDRRLSWKEKNRPREYRSWRELWVFAGGTWSLLARSRPANAAQPGTCPSLDTLAFTIGERLDLPVRTARG
ncbi:MAG: hypothetical protein H6722_00165 [Sandaracinus sp.]|nr:hypothetical protein [Sandaracinus sp.]MCB9610859.1 hypothetical protein [Sandaracinus sp.]